MLVSDRRSLNLFERTIMPLTTLTPASCKGKKRTAVAREILQLAGLDTDVPKVIAELKRLCGEEIVPAAIYTLRKEMQNGQAKVEGGGSLKARWLSRTSSARSKPSSRSARS
jgi:hypothetical protein